MIFIAEVGQIPEASGTAVMRYLLRMNNDPEESKGMTLSYNADSNNAAIGYQYPMRFLTITKFEEFFKMFLDEVERWKQKIVLYTQGTMPNGEDGIVSGSDASDYSSSANVGPEFMIGA
jgi:hypothetical protein